MVTHNSKGSHRFELLPEKRCVLHARHPDPWTSITETGLLMPAENPWGLHPRAQRAGEDCISPFKGLAVVSVTRDSAQKTPGLSEEYLFANLSASAGGVGDRGTEGRHYWTPAYL